MSDQLILVNASDQVIGHDSKVNCHVGDGQLHRAFSLFLFNDQGELLIQRRAPQKPLWPGYWANSCCSHPRRGETVTAAAKRRAREELGTAVTDPNWLFKFQYQARFRDVGSEHELCHVLFARALDTIHPNPDELDQWRWITPADLSEALRTEPDTFTPWLKLEWQRITHEFADQLP